MFTLKQKQANTAVDAAQKEVDDLRAQLLLKEKKLAEAKAEKEVLDKKEQEKLTLENDTEIQEMVKKLQEKYPNYNIKIETKMTESDKEKLLKQIKDLQDKMEKELSYLKKFDFNNNWNLFDSIGW